jgi:hypothetical protein
MVVTLDCGSSSFTWRDLSDQVPDESAGRGWAHHDVALTRDGNIVTYQPAGGKIVILAPDGTILDMWETGLTEAHGITVSEVGRDEVLWVADPGRKMVPHGRAYVPKCGLSHFLNVRSR